ncbi:MAG TPA: hypothetical protein DCM08_11190, partial [Microscillaceae bacterium]|nr:hypothetical protein [Microscillaceae bacterium]
WSTEQQTAFEQQYGYSSMLSTFNAGLNVQKMYLSAAAAAGGDALQSKPFADFITNHPHTFRIEGGKELQLNTFHPSMAKVLNANGIIRVAGHIFQYTRQYIKIIEGGDERQIPKLLAATQDDRAAKIRVFPLTSANNARTGNFRLSCQACIDKGNDPVVYQVLEATMYGTVIGQEYSYPIYGEPQLVCPTDGGGTPLQGPDGEPYCYYAQFIVGYGTNSILGFDFVTRRNLNFLGFHWTENMSTQRTKTVSGNYRINGSQRTIWRQLFNEAVFAQTLYDGPFADFTGFIDFQDFYFGPSDLGASCPDNNPTKLCTVNF